MTVVPLETVKYLPSAINDTLVFMVLGHRISQSAETAEASALSVLRTRMYDHRGKAIRSIHHALDNERLRDTDYALTIVTMLLFGEVSRPRFDQPKVSLKRFHKLICSNMPVASNLFTILDATFSGRPEDDRNSWRDTVLPG